MSNEALLAHIVSQTQANIDFLVVNDYVSHSEASGLLRKLSSLSSPQAQVQPPVSSYIPPAPRQMPIPTTSAPAAVTAKALWDYNKDGSDANDLAFSVGDTITIVEETNADWWMGEVNGRKALFPSNYVEKISTPSLPARTMPPAYNRMSSSPSYTAPSSSTEKPVYRPFGAAHHNAPPPPGSGTNNVGLQQDAGQEQKKGKFGKYGNTMAHSAAGGVGFGAGSAIGGGLVRAIF